MVFLMARPTKLSGSRFPYARKVVPKELRQLLGRTEFKRPLRGATPAEIRRQHAETLARSGGRDRDRASEASGRGPDPERAGNRRGLRDWYREQLAEHEDSPGDEAAWRAWEDQLLAPVSDYEQEEEPPAFEPSGTWPKADSLLRAKGIAADAGSVREAAKGRSCCSPSEARLPIEEVRPRMGRGHPEARRKPGLASEGRRDPPRGRAAPQEKGPEFADGGKRRVGDTLRNALAL